MVKERFLLIMKVRENITVYACDHCKKKMFVRKAMELHEKWCYMNPDNQKACSGCLHLEETEIEYEAICNSFGEDYGVIFDSHTETRKAKGFKCNQLNKILYPLKVEKKGLVQKFPETFENQEPMPRECEHQKFF